jgi:hypothetical protein
MDIKFLDVAQHEFDEAIEYYNGQWPGLGGSVPVRDNQRTSKNSVIPESLASIHLQYSAISNAPFSLQHHLPSA